MPKTCVNNRKKLIICGLFLSKFDKIALNILGFSTFTEAYYTLGFALGGKPMNIKNYRDEFDPYFENSRKGRNSREIRDYCKVIFDEYDNLNLIDFANVIQNFLNPNFLFEHDILQSLNLKQDFYPQRIATGLAAEQFFILNYSKQFKDYNLIDTRFLGCGFDFKLESVDNNFAVEVKGLNENCGTFLLTQKEYNVAKALQDNFCLYIVKNFKENPIEQIIFNPLENIELKPLQQNITNFNYQGMIE